MTCKKRGVICEVLLERWKAAWSGPGPNAEGGCPMCAPESLGFLDQRPKEKVNIFKKGQDWKFQASSLLF